MNKALCNKCENLVAAQVVEREGKVFLVKDCPRCGPTETLIAAVAARYMMKRKLDSSYEYEGCSFDCLNCRHRKQPSFIFVDVTNRCNLNCPICINNTPSMGFLFEPPIEYFEKIFKHFSTYEPRPAIQLFGGEPTVRKDLLDIIALGRKYGLSMRLVTNGLRLADPEYARQIVKSRATVLIAYDGSIPETYGTLRGKASILELKQKAIENLCDTGWKKVALMTCVAKGYNDHEIPALLKFCHDRRQTIRGIYFMPLAHTWDPAKFDLNPERITSEDIETLVSNCFPNSKAEFVPAGIFGRFPTLIKVLGVTPPPFTGAHPNCESFYILVSDGEKYAPLVDFLKSPIADVMREMFELEKRVAARRQALETGLFGRTLAKIGLRSFYERLAVWLSLARAARRHAWLRRIVKGKGVAKVRHALPMAFALLLGKAGSKTFERHTNVQTPLQMIVLPFEDRFVLESERLERCPNAFAYVDPADGQVKAVPVCTWPRHKRTVLRQIADHYAAPPQADANP